MATPREVYSRSIVYLNKVEAGGAPIVVWPKAHHAAGEIVQGLLAAQGEAAYHGARWRDEVIAAMTQPRAGATEPSGYDTKEVSWPGVGPALEVLMGEGDMASVPPPRATLLADVAACRRCCSSRCRCTRPRAA